MINQNLLDYSKKSLLAGYKIDSIKKALLEKGWLENDVLLALKEAQSSATPKDSYPPNTPTPPNHSDWMANLKYLSASQILMSLGGMVIILSAIFFIFMNWSDWNALGKISAIFLPLFVFYIAGTCLFYNNYKDAGIIFLFVGSLLLPILIYFIFKELDPKSLQLDQKVHTYGWLITSLIPLIIYLISSYLFKSPIWSVFCQITGLFFYFFCLNFLGVRDWQTYTWMMLAPLSAYLLAGPLYVKYKLNTENHYSSLLNIPLIIVTLCILLTTALSNNYIHWLWLLFLIGLAYFFVGALYELINYQECSKPLYLLGFLTIMGSAIFLAQAGVLAGKFIDKASGDYKYHEKAIYWSHFIVGLFALAFNYALFLLKKHKFNIDQLYSEALNFFGPLWILGTVFLLSLGGQHPFLETLLLVLSFIFIFSSIANNSQSFLFIGTLFLIIYIFDMGGEYFHNDIGWPATLLISGICSMGIGLVIEKIRKKYLSVTIK